MSFFDLKEGIILTLDQKDTLIGEGKTIQILPIRVFLKEHFN